ncbi:LuxR C-terminal-related transcriptional regulator [Rhodococcus sp. CH91]|uniref:LuxR C-terminal-related transcriptional regulator n=1 Tax=Rhodococcus sp. CH91 TaxID=2910256 RepID=UPI001F4A1958|nr:response regulator transcription factor [Rhodococcus sp. CH91]
MPDPDILSYPAGSALRIVLAEDSPLLRAGIVTVVESDGHTVCAAVGTGDDLVAATLAHRPDLIVTDVRMPPNHTDDGIRAALHLRGHRPDLPILILSQYTTVASLDDLIGDGASAGRAGLGYLLKDRVAHVRHFLDTLSAIARGATVIDPDIITALIGRAGRHGTLSTLSPREREVLALIAQGMTNHQIASRLTVSEAAVRKHVGNIFAKLPLDDSGDRRVLAALTYLNSER